MIGGASEIVPAAIASARWASAVLVENLFSIPGFGRYLFQGIQSRDYPVVQAGVLLASSFFVLLNMLTDIAYAALDPRMRDGGSS